MARTNNLTNFLNDVATAIKTKLGDSTPIPASQFDTKIGEIETGGTYQSKTVNVVTNGSQTITPDIGYDALSSVLINVQVPIPSLQTKNYEFTQNTHIVLSPETGYDGFSSIDLTINVPTGTINNQDKHITENGVYTADQGYTGIGTATVNIVPNVELFTNKQAMQTYIDTNYQSLSNTKRGVVYGEKKIQGIAPNERFTELYLAPEIVLDEPLTRNLNVNMQEESDYGSGGGSYDLWTPEGINFYLFANMSNVTVEYSSEDGQHYTRTNVETSGDEYEGSWNWDENANLLTWVPGEHDEHYKFFYINNNGGTDILLKLFQRPKAIYDGIYRYSQEQLTDYTQSFVDMSDIEANTVPSEAKYGQTNGFILTSNYDKAYGKIKSTINKQGKTVYTFDELYCCNTYDMNTHIFKDGNTVRVGIKYVGGKTVPTDDTSRTITVIKRLSDGTEQKETKTVMLKNAPYYKNNYGYYEYFIEAFNFPYSEMNQWTVALGYNWNDESGWVFYHTSWTNVSSNAIHGSATGSNSVTFWTAIVEDTQLTITGEHQLVPGITGYGVSQAYTGDGSLYNNLDKYYVSTEIFNLTQNERGMLNNLPDKAWSNYLDSKKIGFFKKSNVLRDNYYYVNKLNITENLVPPLKYNEFVSVNSYGNNGESYGRYYRYTVFEELEKIVTVQKDTTNNQYHIVTYDLNGTELNDKLISGLRTTSVSLSLVVTKNTLFLGNTYVYGNAGVTNYIQLFKFRVDTFTLSTIYDQTYSKINSYYGELILRVIDNRWVVYSRTYQSSSSYSYVKCDMYDSNNDTTYSILSDTRFNIGNSRCSIISTPDNIYIEICYYSGSAIHTTKKIVKSNNNITTISGNANRISYNYSKIWQGFEIGTKVFAYTDYNMYYFDTSTSTDKQSTKLQITDGTITKDISGVIKFAINSTDEYIMVGSLLYHILSKVYDTSTNIITITIDNCYYITNQQEIRYLTTVDDETYITQSYVYIDEHNTELLLDKIEITSNGCKLQMVGDDYNAEVLCISLDKTTSLDYDYGIITQYNSDGGVVTDWKIFEPISDLEVVNNGESE